MWCKTIWRPADCGFPDFQPLLGPTDLAMRGCTSVKSVLNLKALNRQRGAATTSALPNTATKDAATWWCWPPAMRIFEALSGAARVETAEAQLKKRSGAARQGGGSAERRSEPGN